MKNEYQFVVKNTYGLYPTFLNGLQL